MILIVGGSYQGKLEFAKTRWSLNSKEIFVCTEDTTKLDHSLKCISSTELFVLGCIRRGIDPMNAFCASSLHDDAIIIITDISCGVVPIDPALRSWREACGRLTMFLSSKAEEVWRLFCGLPQRLK